jgi:hypothetical protein
MDTIILCVEWLGDEHVKPEVMGSSASGPEARVFGAKNHVTCDRVGSSLERVHVNKKMLLFLLADFGFRENLISAGPTAG